MCLAIYCRVLLLIRYHEIVYCMSKNVSLMVTTKGLHDKYPTGLCKLQNVDH